MRNFIARALYESVAIEALLRKRTFKCNYFQWNSKENGWFSVIGTVTHVCMLYTLKSNKWKRASWMSATFFFVFRLLLYSRQNRVIPFIQSMYLHACVSARVYGKVRCCDSYIAFDLGGKWNDGQKAWHSQLAPFNWCVYSTVIENK